MKVSLLLWVPIDEIRVNPQEQVSGCTHHTHPVNAHLCQVSFSLEEWEIVRAQSDGAIILRHIPVA